MPRPMKRTNAQMFVRYDTGVDFCVITSFGRNNQLAYVELKEVASAHQYDLEAYYSSLASYVIFEN